MTVIKRILGISLLLLLIGTSQAQLNLGQTIPTDPQIKTGKLPNGLTYYIRQNKKPEQKVELRLVVNAGSILEDDDQQGLAHMMEHMAFNGTKNFKKNDIVSFLQSIGVQFGADLNANTSFDETIFILPIPTDKPGNLDKGFQILEDWAHQVSNLEDDVNGERNIILEESRSGKGAEDRMFRKLYPTLFAGSKYADRLPIGVDSIIKNFKPDAIRRFYQDWYRPDLMAVIVVGDIDPTKAEDIIKKHFTNLKNPTTERPRVYADVPAYTANQAMILTDKEATNTVVQISYSAYKNEQSTTIGGYKNDLVKGIFSSLLNQRLRELTQKPNPPFLGAGGDFGSYARGYDQFSAYAVTGNGDALTGLKVVMEEIERAKRFGFTQTEVDRAKKNMMATIDRAFKEKDKTESDVYADEYIRNFTTKEPIPGIAVENGYYQTLVPQITLQDVNAIAKKLQEHPNFVVAFTGPEAAIGKELPTKEALLAAATSIAGDTSLVAYEEKAVSTVLLEKLPKPGKVIKETKDLLLGTTTWALSNGTTVTWKKTAFKNDQIIMGAKRPGGSSNYGIADKYNAQYATSVVSSMGIGNFSPTDLQKVLAGKVASAGAGLGSITDGFSGGSSVKDLETMLQLLYLKATSPRIDTGLFQSFIQKSKAQSANMLADPETAFYDTLLKVLYGNNPMANTAVPSQETYDKIDMNRAVAIYKERFGDATGMNFVFVGSLDPLKLKPLVERYIGGLPASGKKFTYKDNGLRPVKGKVNMEVFKGQADKSLILSMHSGEVAYSEDLDMKAGAISEILNIKIIEELREKIQGIYSGGMSGGLEKLPYPHYSFFINLPCGPEKVDTLLYAMNTEIENLKKFGPSKANLDKVKQQWLEANKTSMKENGTWLGEITTKQFPGTDVDRFLNYEKYVKALTPKMIQDAAIKLLDGKNVVTAVLKPGK